MEARILHQMIDSITPGQLYQLINEEQLEYIKNYDSTKAARRVWAITDLVKKIGGFKHDMERAEDIARVLSIEEVGWLILNVTCMMKISPNDSGSEYILFRGPTRMIRYQLETSIHRETPNGIEPIQFTLRITLRCIPYKCRKLRPRFHTEIPHCTIDNVKFKIAKALVANKKFCEPWL